MALKLAKKIKETPKGSKEWKWTSGKGREGCSGSVYYKLKYRRQILVGKHLDTINTKLLVQHGHVELISYDHCPKSLLHWVPTSDGTKVDPGGHGLRTYVMIWAKEACNKVTDTTGTSGTGYKTVLTV